MLEATNVSETGKFLPDYEHGCLLVEVHRHSGGAGCLHHQGDDGVTSEKTVIFILAAVRN
jgi:hypothetical protein